MSKIEILAIGRNVEILETVVRLINNNKDWQGTGANQDEEAIEKFHRQHFDIILLTNGISEEEETKLRKIFTHQQPGIIIIQHYGGGSGLLFCEIQEALDKRKTDGKHTVSVTDDIFKSG